MHYLAIVSDIHISHLCLRHLFSACCVLSLMLVSDSRRKKNTFSSGAYDFVKGNGHIENNIHLSSAFNLLDKGFIYVAYNVST